MSFLSSLFAWASVPFTVALGVAVVFALLQMTGILGLLAGGDHDGDADHDGSADADGDADADADADGDADGDHDADADGDHDADNDNDGAHGRAPISIVWQTFAISFGFAGLATNIVYAGQTGALPPSALAWSLPIALVFGVVVTRTVSRAIGRIIANPNQLATSRKQLVGQAGVVISSKVNDEFGEVRLRDKKGHVLRIICRTRPGEKVIPEGREVVFVEYDREADRLFVAPLDDDDDAPAPKALAGAAKAVKSAETAEDQGILAAEDEALAAEEAAARRDRSL